MSELKPCPFCGATPIWSICGENNDLLRFGCPNNCAVWMEPFTRPYHENALKSVSKRWNRRAQPAEPLAQGDIDKMHFDKVWLSYGDHAGDGELGVVLFGQLYSIDTLEGAGLQDMLDDLVRGESLDCSTGQYEVFRTKAGALDASNAADTLTWVRSLDGYTDIGLRRGVTIDDAIWRLAELEGTLSESEGGGKIEAGILQGVPRHDLVGDNTAR